MLFAFGKTEEQSRRDYEKAKAQWEKAKREAALELERRLEIIAVEYFDLPKTLPEIRRMQILSRISREFVPGLRIAQYFALEKPKGQKPPRKLRWSAKAKAKLFLDVREYKRSKKCSDAAACLVLVRSAVRKKEKQSIFFPVQTASARERTTEAHARTLQNMMS